MTRGKIKSNRKIKLKRKLTDGFLAVIGLSLAAASLYFPWHVYHNEDAVILPRLQFSGRADLYGEPEDRIVPGTSGFVSPVAGQLIDPVITGSIADETSVEETTPTSADGEILRGYKVLHSANGLALVRDADSLFLVKRGSHLPDGSKVNSISRNDESWQLTTSDGYRIVEQ